MFSFSEMFFIGVLALIVIGPKQLPAVARNIGRFMNEMRRASESVFSEFKNPTVPSPKPMAKEAVKPKDESKNDSHS